MTPQSAIIPSDLERRALDLARAAQKNAHAPYSGKQVGAAVITRSGAIFAGCNVENGTHELDICAEHNAMTTAVAAGEREFVTVIVIAPDERFWPPCASCRHVIGALAPSAEILMSTRDGRLHRARLDQLGDRPFTPDVAASSSEPVSSPTSPLSVCELAAHIDHTNLKPDATAADIELLCREARANGFAAVCVQPVRVQQAASLLTESHVAVCGVVGFPTGAHPSEIKAAEAAACIRAGAREIDMVANAGWLRDGDYSRYVEDIRAVRQAVGDDIILKVIIEATLLVESEIIRAAELAVEGKADFVKTSTGVYGQARIEDVQLLRRILPPRVKIKAAGGIRTVQAAFAFIAAGAERIGTSVSIRLLERPRDAL